MSCPEYPAAVGLHVTVYNTLGDKDWVTEAIYSLTHYIGGVIAQLEAEHAQGAARIAALRDALELYRRTGAAGLAGFDAALKVYTEQEWRHMNTEEREVFPLAQKHLNAEDWAAIDAAFLANGNPWEGAAGEYAALFTKIVNIAPAPVGLGG